jgi:ubiquinone biosynthesis protein UbiJ
MLPLFSSLQPTRLAALAVNGLLRREAWARERLTRHAGKTVRFVLGGFTLSLSINSEGYADMADPAIVPDVTLTVAAEKLGATRWFGAARATGVSAAHADNFAEMTHISGDAALAQVVADLAAHLRWDVEDELARLVGDIPAARLVAGARALAAGARGAAQRVGANVAEYLAHETPVLTAQAALRAWGNEVAVAAGGVETLAARLGRLEARLARRGKGGA